MCWLTQHWYQPDGRGAERRRRCLRRMGSALLGGLAGLSFLGHAVPPVPAGGGDEDGRAVPGGLPPGHPERLAAEQPMTPAERELWTHLDGIDGW